MKALARIPLENGRRTYPAPAGSTRVTHCRWINTKGAGSYDFVRADYEGAIKGHHFIETASGAIVLSVVPGPGAEPLGAVLEVQFEKGAPAQGGLFG